MAIRMNAAPRRLLAASALAGLIALAAVPGAMAQWLPPWRAFASPGDIAGQLEAQGYVLIAPLQRRPGVYLADVRAGPAGYQRLVIDDRNGEILERFSVLAARLRRPFAATRWPNSPSRYAGVFQTARRRILRRAPRRPGYAEIRRTADRRTCAFRARSARSARRGRRSRRSRSPPRSPARSRHAKTAPPMVSPPLPPPAPREAAKPEEAPSAPTPAPKIESPPGESENASAASAPAAPEAKPAAPGSSAEARDKSKVSIVPPALFE